MTPLGYLKMGGGILVAILFAALVANRGLWMHRAHVYLAQYNAEHTAHVQDIANYRAAADEAKRLDAANVARVQAQQTQINQESTDAYQKRLADARAAADRLRAQLAASTHSGSRSRAPVPSVSAPAIGPNEAAGQDGLPPLSIDDRLTATTQAIQLDELIKWVSKQANVDVNGNPPKAQGSKP